MNDLDPDDGLEPGLRAAFPQQPAGSILDVLSQRSGVRPRVTLRDEPSDTGERPLRPLAGSDPPVPQETGKYHVQGEIARGGVGVVFKSHDTDLGRDVAMKVLHERYLDDPDVLRRFIEEAQIGAQLQHPGIVPVYDLGLSREQPYFTMKLIKGRTLASLLEDRSGPQENSRKLLAIFEQVCQTMAYAHSRGVIHRDLKPANIMVGPFGEVQVVDWGMGKVVPRGGVADEARSRRKSDISVIATIRSDKDGSKSLVGSVLGTPAYMPPEQANGAVDQMDERSDVFALGAVLCEILTGQAPYAGDAEGRLAAAANADLEDCRKRLAACGADQDLVALARDCLMPVPAARPRDASKLAQRLADYLAAVEERARQAQIDAAEQRVQAVAARRSQRLTVALAASILVTLAVAGAGAWWFERVQQERRTDASVDLERELSEAAEAHDLAHASAAGDLTLWTQAVAAAERARDLLDAAHAPEEQRERVLQAVQRYRGARDEARRALELQQMTARLASIGEPPADVEDGWPAYDPYSLGECTDRAEAYRVAFHDHGLPLLEMDLNDVALALDEVPDPDLVVWLTALDDWALVLEIRFGENWPARRHLLQIAAAVDENPFRLRLRDLLFRGSVTAESLAELVRDPGVPTIPEAAALAVAQRLLQLKEWELLREVLEPAQQQHPDSHELAFWLARAYYFGGGPGGKEEALRFFTAAHVLRPDSTDAIFERAQCARELGRRDEAIALYGQVLGIHPDHFGARDFLAGLLLEKGNAERAVGDEEGALREYRHGIDLDPESELLHNNLAWLLANARTESLRDPAAAVFHARRAVEIDPASRNSHATLGAALHRAGEFEEAIQVLELARRMESETDDPFLYLFLALARHALGEEERALSSYRQATALLPAEAERTEEEQRLFRETRQTLGLEH